MAKGKLTERQEQIVELLNDGKTPAEVGKKLKITTNGVYQQMRRIRKVPGYKSIGGVGSGGTTTKASTGRSRSTAKARSASTGRQSSRTAARAAAEPQAEVIVKPPSAKDVLTAEVRDTKAKIAEQQAVIDQAAKDTEKAQQAIAALTVELTAREDTLAVLTGEKVAHAKPAPKAKPAEAAKPSGNGGSGKPAGRKTAAQAVKERDEAEAKAKAEREAQEGAPASTEPPQASTETTPDPEAAPDPFEGSDDAAAQAAAESSQEAPAAA